MDEHGDLPITTVFGATEYTLREPQFVEEGPCRNISDRQNQSPPARILFEAKDDIPDSE